MTTVATWYEAIISDRDGAIELTEHCGYLLQAPFNIVRCGHYHGSIGAAGPCIAELGARIDRVGLDLVARVHPVCIMPRVRA